MIPLWITAIVPDSSVCGCAFSREGLPCVAQRVWPSADEPASGSVANIFSRFVSLPGARRRTMAPSTMDASPEES